jgi:hypothetical protein
MGVYSRWAGLRFGDLVISHLPSCSPSLHRVMLHGFIATTRALTSAGPLPPTLPISPVRSHRRAILRRGPGPLFEQCPPLLLVTVRRPRPVPGSSPYLSRLTFRPFRLQPPHRHFVTVAFTRCFTAVTCRVYPTGRPRGSRDFAVARSRVRTLLGASPTGLAVLEFTCVTDGSFVSGCSPHFLTENAVTTFDYRPATLA